jgi:hypothetical protein
MRTTLTLEDDVAVLLERLRRERGLTFKEIVNQALREGLLALETKPAVQPFRTRTVSAGRCLLPNLDCVSEVLAVTEGENHR